MVTALVVIPLRAGGRRIRLCIILITLLIIIRVLVVVVVDADSTGSRVKHDTRESKLGR